MAIFQVKPGRKEIYIWNGYEYALCYCAVLYSDTRPIRLTYSLQFRAHARHSLIGGGAWIRYGFVERPEGFDEEDEDGDGIFSIEEQKAAREKRAAEAEASPMFDDVEDGGAPEEGFENPLKNDSGGHTSNASFEIEESAKEV